ncbi:hypothetical protein DC3_27220 [Deinococcus cellulosilyticus NBRC 106333 = KACC 11606]|uniref:Uncharacterized protein n=2 Tax=Deinococcus cellulosilyticus TaxID=401558 RepID=A0A511N3N2_DEIC1|nr:hypothetical protein DC3_27220 [Deinococcus cellulosilyticus NBRC 106333 = KACC 11606]
MNHYPATLRGFLEWGMLETQESTETHQPSGLKQTLGVLKDAVQAFSLDNVPRMGAALAYHTIFTIGPLLILAVGIAGLFLETESIKQNIYNQMSEGFGSNFANSMQSVLELTSQAGLPATISGVVILLWTASNFFIHLQDALNTIWDIKPKHTDILHLVVGRLMSAILAIVLGLLMVAFLTANVYVTAFAAEHFGFIPYAPFLLKLGSLILSILVFTVLFGVLYRFLPNIRLSWQDVSFGAGITAILFVIGQYAISLYIARFSPANTFGAAGTLVVFMLWVYFSAQLFFFGAEVTWAYSNKFGTIAARTAAHRAKEKVLELSQPEPEPRKIPPMSKATFSVAGFLGGVVVVLVAIPAMLVLGMRRLFQRRRV